MNRYRRSTAGVSLAFLVGAGAVSTPTCAGGVFLGLSFSKEGKVPETEWLPYDRYPDDVAQAHAEWSRIRPILEQQLTFASIKESLGLEETDLGFPPDIRDLGAIISQRLNPYAHIDKGGGRRWLVFEGRFGPLRPAIPLVERWLKTYVTYDTLDQRIVRVTLAVVGEKYE